MIYVTESVFVICALFLTLKVCQLMNVVIKEASQYYKLKQELLKREFDNGYYKD